MGDILGPACVDKKLCFDMKWEIVLEFFFIRFSLQSRGSATLYFLRKGQKNAQICRDVILGTNVSITDSPKT